MNRFLKYLTVAAGLNFVAASPALAGELGSTSSETMTITVIVAPIGAAVAAEQQGAVGSWTISGLNQGLMIDLPDQITPGSDQSFSLYAATTSTLTARPVGAGARIAAAGSNFDRGLGRQDFVLSRDAATPAERSMVVLIASL